MAISRGISWSTWLEERDAAPLELFSSWLREQVPGPSNEQRAPNLNRQPDRLEELSREVFNTQRRHSEAYTVDQADLLECVEAMAAMPHSADGADPESSLTSRVDAARAKCRKRLRSEFGPPELPLPFEVFCSYLKDFISEYARDEQGREVLLQHLIVQSHLSREARKAEEASRPRNEALSTLDADEDLAMALNNDQGPEDAAVGIATPQGRCRRPRKKAGYKAMFGAVCGP